MTGDLDPCPPGNQGPGRSDVERIRDLRDIIVFKQRLIEELRADFAQPLERIDCERAALMELREELEELETRLLMH